MPEKLSFVSSRKGELSVMIAPPEVVVGVDLAMPGLAPFVIKRCLEPDEDIDLTFQAMLEGVWCLVESFFKHQGVSEDLIEGMGRNMMQALATIVDPEKEREEDGILGHIRSIEEETLFEAEFDIPEEFLEQAHRKVVTAATIIRRTPEVKERPTHTAPQTKIVVRPQPSLKQVIQKYRTQQNKPVTGPLYVIVYDACGRPVGVRSIKAPGWKGLGGKVAHAAQWDTPEFKAWFAGSKVVDKQGNPLRVYHGTARDFEVFDPGKARGWSNFNAMGSFFTAHPHVAGDYAGPNPLRHSRVLPVYLSLKNPYVLDVYEWQSMQSNGRGDIDPLWPKKRILEFKKSLIEAGYDGVVDSIGAEFIAFSPNQIKSAIGNNGKFDPEDNRITASAEVGFTPHVHVYHSPDPSILSNFEDMARAFYCPVSKELLVWDGYDGTHADVRTQEALPADAIPFFIWDGSTASIEAPGRKPEWVQILQDAPSVQALLGPSPIIEG